MDGKLIISGMGIATVSDPYFINPYTRRHFSAYKGAWDVRAWEENGVLKGAIMTHSEKSKSELKWRYLFHRRSASGVIGLFDYVFLEKRYVKVNFRTNGFTDGADFFFDSCRTIAEDCKVGIIGAHGVVMQCPVDARCLVYAQSSKGVNGVATGIRLEIMRREKI